MAGLSSFRKREYHFQGIKCVYVICYVNMINNVYLINISQYKYIFVRILVYREMVNKKFFLVYAMEEYIQDRCMAAHILVIGFEWSC
jgi:hypothetical protein